MKTIVKTILGAALGYSPLALLVPQAQAATVTEAWVQRYNGPANSGDGAQAIAMDGSGNVVVTGYSFDLGSGISDFSVAIYTAKYALADGALLWEKRDHGLMGIDTAARALAVDASGNVVVAGYSHNGRNYDYYTAKYAAADGALLWKQRHNGPGNHDDIASAVAVDGSGNVVVTGTSRDIGSLPNYYTVKYAAADGALLWERRSPGLIDYATAMALDGKGNVVVTGRSGDGGGGFDYYTAKYAAADGAVLWQQRSDSPRSGGGVPSAVAVDSSGNVLVTGSSEYFDYYTVKYAAADGALIWEVRYDGPLNGWDYATAVAVDSSGNVVVTGGSGIGDDNGIFIGDFYTAKYAAADGALLWEKRASGLLEFPIGRDSAVAVDGGGNVLVTGHSSDGSYLNLYTAKYAAADGALLWEKVHSGLINGWLQGGSPSLAVGSDGVVAVTSTSSDDIVTILYRENQPPVIACPVGRVVDLTSSAGAVVNFTVTAPDDSGVLPILVCVPRSGSLFPIGQTTVTCTATDGDRLSSTCSFIVTVSGARAITQTVLTELIALRTRVTDREDGRNLDEAIGHLTASVAAALWVDETHLNRQYGEQVFHGHREAVKHLCHLMKSRKSRIPDGILQGFVDRIFQATRLLATVAIQDASTAGVSPTKIEQARRFLARGDAEVGDDKCANGIEDYRNAWKFAIAP